MIYPKGPGQVPIPHGCLNKKGRCTAKEEAKLVKKPLQPLPVARLPLFVSRVFLGLLHSSNCRLVVFRQSFGGLDIDGNKKAELKQGLVFEQRRSKSPAPTRKRGRASAQGC